MRPDLLRPALRRRPRVAGAVRELTHLSRAVRAQCHTLGGSFSMPHAETHTVILPHAVAYNAPYAQDAVARVAKAIGTDNAAQGLFDLAKENGAPTSLKELGFKKEDLEKAADIAAKAP